MLYSNFNLHRLYQHTFDPCQPLSDRRITHIISNIFLFDRRITHIISNVFLFDRAPLCVPYFLVFDFRWCVVCPNSESFSILQITNEHPGHMIIRNFTARIAPRMLCFQSPKLRIFFTISCIAQNLLPMFLFLTDLILRD